MSFIIRDSATVNDSNAFAAHNRKDSSIKMGIVREIYQSSSSEIKYIVEAQMAGLTTPLVCSLMTRWGGVQNFEEYGLRSYHGSTSTDAINGSAQSMETRVGDVVIVACIQGNYREGIILGGIRHPGRKAKILPNDIAYLSQFNGVETTISNKGAYKVTNRAVVSTALDFAVPGAPIPPEVLNPTVSGSFFELGDDGSFTISDNMQQTLKVDKSGQTTTITSGKCSIKLETISGTTTIAAPTLTITNDIKTEITTKALNMEATLTAKLKAKQIAIGNDSFELINGLVKLIDALGALVVVSPAGPCNPLQATPTWTQVIAIKQQLTMLKGSL